MVALAFLSLGCRLAEGIDAFRLDPIQRRPQTTDLTFVRHGETLANATGRYSAKTLNNFSAKGEAEVVALTKQLERMPRFQVILVSPAGRTLKTIAPYLRATHQKAVIWPLLYECCTGRRPKDAHATRFTYGPKIQIPADLADLFIVRSGADRFPNAPDYDSGLAQIAAAEAAFRQYEGKRVLLVGHSGMGGHFIHDLTGKWQRLDNATPYSYHL